MKEETLLNMESYDYKRTPQKKKLKKQTWNNYNYEGYGENDVYHNSNFFSKLFFLWIHKSLQLAEKKSLTLDKLGIIDKENSSANYYPEIALIWEGLRYCDKKTNALIKTFLKFYFWELCICILGEVLLQALEISELSLLHSLINSFHSSKENSSLKNICICFICTKLMYTFVFRQLELYKANLSMKSIMRLNIIIFNKVLTSSYFAKGNNLSLGDIITYIQVDSYKMGNLFKNIPKFFILPMKIIVYVVILFYLFGLSFIIGILPLFLILYLNHQNNQKFKGIERKLLMKTGERMKVTEEVLDAIKIIKMYGWENFFHKKILNVREQELKWIKKKMTKAMFGQFSFWNGPILITITTIAIYQYLNPILEVSNILVGLYIFDLLQTPFIELPLCLFSFFSLKISMNRIEKYIRTADVKTRVLSSEKYPDSAIVINNICFNWSKKGKNNDKKNKNQTSVQDKFSLKIANINIKKGELVGVIGEIGSGKSSLIQAILNNMNMVQQNQNISNQVNQQSSEMIVNGTLGYTEQIPWIQNQTLRDNILFFNPYNKNKYEDILKIVQLKEDIELLPGNDLTEIGEKGINLSGGQKSRVSLARALYAEKDIYLFDDPLSSLDADIGRKVFSECFQNHLKNKTRIIATHNLQYMPFFDRILWINKGEILFEGSLKELEKQAFYKLFTTTLDAKRRQSITLEKRKKVLTSVSLINIESLINKFGCDNGKKMNLSNSSCDKELIQSKNQKAHNERQDVFNQLYNYSGNQIINNPTLNTICPHPERIDHVIDEFIPLTQESLAKKRNSFVIENVINDIHKNFQLFDSQNFIQINKNEKPQHSNHYNSYGSKDIKEEDTDKDNSNLSEIDSDIHILKEKSQCKINTSSLKGIAIINEIKKEDQENHSENELIYRTTVDEDQELGSTNLGVYLKFFEYMGGPQLFLRIILVSISWQGLRIYSDIFLVNWAKVGMQKENDRWLYLVIFATLSIAGTIFMLLRIYLFNKGSIRFVSMLHDDMMNSLIKAPINHFYDVTPKGQIYNRLSKDLMNTNLSISSMSHILSRLFTCFGVLFISLIYEKYSLLFTLILGFFVYLLYKYYIVASRNMQRIYAITLSPMMSLVSEAFSGINTIRVFNIENAFKASFVEKVNEHMKIGLFQNGLHAWLGLYMDLIALAFITLLLIFFLMYRVRIDNNVIGLVIIYALRLKTHIFVFIYTLVSYQNQIISLERCLKFTEIPQEKPGITEKDLAYKNISELETSTNIESNNKKYYHAEDCKIWPAQGAIEFLKYSVQYRSDTPIVLSNLCFKVKAGEKLGIVGRTGSGKSTICNSLFRILEPLRGKIIIDGEDITKLGLENLRKNMSIIPQDPYIFHNTLRFNIDPLNLYSREEIEDVLNKIGFNYNRFSSGILTRLGSKDSLSVGERQLICIARTILRKSKIVVMDEATASIDFQTEEKIQKALHVILKDTTIITVAHRIKTVLTYDKILVLDKGKIQEYNTPEILLNDKNSFFYRMYNSAHASE